MVENKVRSSNVERVRNKCCRHSELIHKCVSDGVSKVWMCWNPQNLDFVEISKNSQVITCEATIKECDKSFVITGVYGYSLSEDQKELWQYLRGVASYRGSSLDNFGGLRC